MELLLLRLSERGQPLREALRLFLERRDQGLDKGQVEGRCGLEVECETTYTHVLMMAYVGWCAHTVRTALRLLLLVVANTLMYPL